MLFHSLDPFDNGLTELFHALLLRGHWTGLPTIRGFEPPVCNSTLDQQLIIERCRF